jgi:predicted RNase H-like HicB family nuclease
VHGYVILTVQFHKEGKYWTAECVELGTATFGRTVEEADERIKEAVLLHLNTLEDVGERERFFEEYGIKYHIGEPEPERISISAPLDEETFVRPYIQHIPVLAGA